MKQSRWKVKEKLENDLVPHGYEYDEEGELVITEEEAEKIKKAFEIPIEDKRQP